MHLASGTKYEIPVHTVNGNTDFAAFCINAVALLQPDLRVFVINLSSQLKGTSLFCLLNFRFGCLHPPMLEILIKRGVIKGIPVTPLHHASDNFQCPICLSANAKHAASNHGADHVISVEGTRFHADFLFPSKISIQGYMAALLIVNPLTSHGWVFICRSKHSPIQLLIWFITHLCQQLAFSVLWTDGGGELCGLPALVCSVLSQIHCQMKTTGGYNASANGSPETGGGLIKCIMQFFLHMGGKEANPFP
jgi:hypothetical protein